MFECDFSDGTPSGETGAVSQYKFYVTITLGDGSEVKLYPYSVTYSAVGNGQYDYKCKFAAEVGEDGLGRISTVMFETDVPSYTAGGTLGRAAYSTFMNFCFATEMTDEMRQHQELIGAIGNAADQITDKIDESTDQITGEIDESTQDIIANDNANAEKTHGFLQNIWDSIVSLPQKLWSLIETGLKALFVPDEEYMSGYSDKWDTLLADRFGAVYQVCDIVMDSWEDIHAADQQDTIDMPVVSIPLPGNNTFSFGGYTVKVVPDGFGVLVDALKLITGILASVAFCNGLLKKYNELMGADDE